MAAYPHWRPELWSIRLADYCYFLVSGHVLFLFSISPLFFFLFFAAFLLVSRRARHTKQRVTPLLWQVFARPSKQPSASYPDQTVTPLTRLGNDDNSLIGKSVTAYEGCRFGRSLLSLLSFLRADDSKHRPLAYSTIAELLHYA